MRRQKLLWFALGAGATATAAALTHFLTNPTDDPSPYLAILERPYSEGEIERMGEIHSTTAPLLRECGAKEFFIKSASGSHGLPYSIIKIAKENEIALRCILERAKDEDYPVHIQMLTDQQAAVV